MFDVIQAIDACYAPRRSNAEWIDGLLATVQEISAGRGAYAISFAPRPGGLTFGTFEVLGQRGPLPDVAALGAPINALLDENTYRALYEPHPAVELLSRRARRMRPATAAALANVFRSMGIRDAMAVYGGEPEGVVLILIKPPSRPCVAVAA